MNTSRFSGLTVLSVVLTAVAVPAQAQDETIGIPVGSAVAASIPVEDLDGNAVNLADYMGKKPVIVEFWATWCPLCAAIMPQLEAARKLHPDDVEFLIVAVGVGQSRNSVKRHVAQHPLPGKVFWDATGAATRAFQAPSTSYIATLDAKGRVRYTGLGSKQNVEVAIQKAVGRTGG